MMNAAKSRRLYKTFPADFARFAVVFSFGFLLLAPVAAFAETLKQYHEDVKVSNTLIENLLYPADDDEDSSAESRARLEQDTLKRIRNRLPATETVEWQGGSVETDNRWLAESLDKFERTPSTDNARGEILIEIADRLEAIERKIGELEKPPVSSRSKDEDKQKLAEILRREEYQKPPEKKEPSLAEKIQKQIADWLESIFPRPNITPSTNIDFQPLSVVLQILLYALILGIIAFVVYRFTPFFAKKFRRRETNEKKERVILGERLADDETAQNLFSEAENLARRGDLRGAIRKGYIALLCDLSDRRMIRLSHHKTNRDYLRDVRSKTELYQNMNGLTLNYERHWYGFDEANAADWENFRDGYRRAVREN